MSLSIIYTRASIGIDAPLVTVEVHLSNGLPSLSIVGMPEAVVRESKDRVRSALINSEFEFPARRITINLAPADTPKHGSRFDLPIAIGILAASGQIPSEHLAQYEFIGELALSGELRPVHAILPCAIATTKANKQLVTERNNAEEAARYPRCEALGASNLLEVCAHLTQMQRLTVSEAKYIPPIDYPYDFLDVKGQLFAKRALEIAAAGGHNLLFYGPPGTGKTMLASRLPSIMPPLTEAQSVEVSSIYSLGGHHYPYGNQPAFRNPHHTSSAAALVGGGSIPKPGEISLSHHGVLFLDELPEFPRQVLEVLREPLESGEIRISRASAQVCFPASFQFVAAMNPCPCGYYGSQAKHHTCRCSPDVIRRYQQKISGPLLDRIDLHIPVHYTLTSELEKMPEGENSLSIQQRVISARDYQQRRQNKINARLNQQDIKMYCALTVEDEKFIFQAVDRLGLSTRGFYRVLKTARTIADLSGRELIVRNDLSEALALRGMS